MKKLALVLSFSILLFGFGCSKDKKGISLCKKVVNKFVACGVLTEGTIDCDNFIGEDLDAEWKCELRCITKAECDEVEVAVCDGTAMGDFEDCVDACWDKYAFECDDGLYSIHPSWVCDCEEDCADGSDEMGCPASACFECADGHFDVIGEWECDCWLDCDDGSDEADCPTNPCFECADGLFDIPPEWECDCYEDCADGSDEMGCPAKACFDCADGLYDVPSDWVCDFEADCDDGSDEEGCAEFICP